MNYLHWYRYCQDALHVVLYISPWKRSSTKTTLVAKSQLGHFPTFCWLTSDLVSNCSQSPDPVGKIPIVEHFHNPSASLFISTDIYHAKIILTLIPDLRYKPAWVMSMVHTRVSQHLYHSYSIQSVLELQRLCSVRSFFR
jgi:hypothetical protein